MPITVSSQAGSATITLSGEIDHHGARAMMEQLEDAIVGLESYVEYLGTDINYSTTYIQDYMGLYDSYTSGATSAIDAANKTLSDLMMSGTMLGSGLGMTVTALIVGLAVGAGVTALVLKKKSSKAS